MALRIVRALALLAPIALLTGACGRLDVEGRDVSTQASNLQSASLQVDADGDFQSDTNRDGTYDCPSDPNVMPGYDFDGNGSRRYRACKPKSNGATVLLHGRSTGNARICVFPAVEANSINVQAVLDSTGHAMRSCTDVGSGATAGETPARGVEFAFPGVSFNAVFVVEGLDDDHMEYCLRTGNTDVSLCPRYSYGKFR